MNLEYLSVRCPEHIENLVSMGDFNQARDAIEKHMTLGITPILKQRLEHELLTLGLIEKEFVYTKAELFKALSPYISNLTLNEIDTFESEGYLLWHMVASEKKYHKSAVKMVLKENITLESRLTLEGYEPSKAYLSAYRALDDAISTMQVKGEIKSEMIVESSIRVKAGLELKSEIMCEHEMDQEKIIRRFYIPFPRRAHFTKQVELLETSNMPYQMARDTAFQRVVYFETHDEIKQFRIKYRFLNHMIYRPIYEVAEGLNDLSKGASEVVTEVDTEDILKDVYKSLVHQKPLLNLQNIDLYETLTEADEARFLDEKSPHILFTPLLRALAEQIVGDETQPLLKVKRLYDYITKHVHYRFMGSYRTLHNISEYGALNLRGDCGVQSLLFITLLRIVGVPATFASGLTVIPNMGLGMHDWSAFYVAPLGWCFADVSYGESAYRRGHLDKWRFYFGNVDPYRLMSNFDFQVPFEFPKQFMRDDPYDNQVGEIETNFGSLFSEDIISEIQLISTRELIE